MNPSHIKPFFNIAFGECLSNNTCNILNDYRFAWFWEHPVIKAGIITCFYIFTINTCNLNETGSLEFSKKQGLMTFPQSHITSRFIAFPVLWHNYSIFFAILKSKFENFLFSWDYSIMLQLVWNTQPIPVPVWQWKLFNIISGCVQN
jgi:hypothetical protein